MALVERLIGLEAPKIAVHAFFGGMQEYMKGSVSGAEMTALFGLDAAEQTDALALRDAILAVTNTNAAVRDGLREARASAFERLLLLAEQAPTLRTVAQIRTRLGLSNP